MMHDVFKPPLVFSGWTILAVSGLFAYIVIVRLLRHQRAKDLPRRHGLTDRASYSKMTTNQAQSILKDLTELEFPKTFGFSVIFALFKVHLPPD